MPPSRIPAGPRRPPVVMRPLPCGSLAAMESFELDELVKVLQTAISPVAVISGVGLLLLSLTNRIGRTTDRARALAAERRRATPQEAARLDRQIRILYRRARILRRAIALALASVLFVSLIVVALFAIYLAHARLQGVVVALFVLGLASLVASLVDFLRDIGLSLSALRQELGEVVGPPAGGPGDPR